VYPSFSAVVFSEVSKKGAKEDGYLSVEEAALLRMNPELLMLSACETGLGKLSRGDGVVGLTRAFHVAGAKRVGVTLWQVNDRGTMEFMKKFYRRAVKEGMDYGEALVETRREFMRSGEFGDPYYWAGFVLYGE